MVGGKSIGYICIACGLELQGKEHSSSIDKSTFFSDDTDLPARYLSQALIRKISLKRIPNLGIQSHMLYSAPLRADKGNCEGGLAADDWRFYHKGVGRLHREGCVCFPS